MPKTIGIKMREKKTKYSEAEGGGSRKVECAVVVRALNRMRVWEEADGVAGTSGLELWVNV